jgi:hypothetical protein
VQTINGEPIGPSSACICDELIYTPQVLSSIGFNAGVSPLPALVSRLGNVITISGIAIATNTLSNFGSCVMTLPPTFPTGGAITDFVRGTGTWWNNENDVNTGLLVPVHIVGLSTTTFQMSVNALPRDGPICYMLQYRL